MGPNAAQAVVSWGFRGVVPIWPFSFVFDITSLMGDQARLGPDWPDPFRTPTRSRRRALEPTCVPSGLRTAQRAASDRVPLEGPRRRAAQLDRVG